MSSLLALLGQNFTCTLPSSPSTLAESPLKNFSWDSLPFLLCISTVYDLIFTGLWSYGINITLIFALQAVPAPKVLNRLVVSINEQASQKYANIHSTDYLGSALSMQARCQIWWHRRVTRSSGPMGVPWVTGNDMTWSWLQRVWSVKGQTANEKSNNYRTKALFFLLTFPSLPSASSTFVT